jgi:hypothetical protein
LLQGFEHDGLLESWPGQKAGGFTWFYHQNFMLLHGSTLLETYGNTVMNANSIKLYQIVEVATKTMNCLCEVQLQKGRRKRTLKLLNECGNMFPQTFRGKMVAPLSSAKLKQQPDYGQ